MNFGRRRCAERLKFVGVFAYSESREHEVRPGERKLENSGGRIKPRHNTVLFRERPGADSDIGKAVVVEPLGRWHIGIVDVSAKVLAITCSKVDVLPVTRDSPLEASQNSTGVCIQFPDKLSGVRINRKQAPILVAADHEAAGVFCRARAAQSFGHAYIFNEQRVLPEAEVGTYRILVAVCGVLDGNRDNERHYEGISVKIRSATAVMPGIIAARQILPHDIAVIQVKGDDRVTVVMKSLIEVGAGQAARESRNLENVQLTV